MGKAATKKKAKAEQAEESTNLPAVQDERAVVRTVSIEPVTLVDAGVDVNEIKGLPEEFKRAQTLSGFPPSPKWERPGQALFGYFLNLREDIGPNHSRLYEISVPQADGEDPITCAVWGSAALDRLFDSAPQRIEPGDKVAIIFLGEKPTKRGLHPVKLFAIRHLKIGGNEQKLHSA